MWKYFCMDSSKFGKNYDIDIPKIPTHESKYFIKHARLNISSENLINSSLKHPGMRVSCTLCIAFITNAT